VHENDVGGLIDYFMPVLGGRKSLDRTNSLKEFQDIFAIIKPPEVVGRSESDEYFAEMMVAGAGPDAINPNGRRAREVPDHLRSPAECA
jgi:arachidonate 15-lipoxygenase